MKAILAFLLASVPVNDHVEIGGHVLGLAQGVRQEHRTATDGRLDGFDFAGNLDVTWTPHEHWTGFVQFQGGTGGGSVGFQGAGVNVTDLNLAYHRAPTSEAAGSWDDPDITLTVGSFDTPFGEETGRLTNNADATSNALFLNSLFYSSFGGVTGTLNTLGVMTEWEAPWFDAALAVTNGTDESANNADGNFEWVARIGTGKILPGLRIAGSYMASDDTAPSGQSGFGADLRAWMGEAGYEWNDLTHLRGYYGDVRYGDNDGSTRDDVRIWMGEAAFGRGRWQLAARYSGWDPDDADGSSAGMSSVLPNPGLAVTQSAVTPVRDQEVRRLQLGGSYRIVDAITLKAEYFRDDYRRNAAGRSTDVDGGFLLLQGAF